MLPKIQAKACMLFPRTQYIQLQQEYFNVGLSFELFLRAFGELDVLHEDQVTDDTLHGYKLLLLFDVELLPDNVAGHIATFVRGGGVVIADCAPRRNADRQPMSTMEELFGVQDVQTGRIRRSGHWVPYRTQVPVWANRPANAPDETVFATDTLRAEVFGTPLDLKLVSPRPCTVTTGRTLAATASGRPAVVHRNVDRGQVFLLGFCLQDTYFQTWEDNAPAARAQLGVLLQAMTRAAGIRPHVASSNADIEAAVRINQREGFLFIINHEAKDPETTVHLADLPFPVAAITNLGSGKPVAFSREGQDEIELDLSVPLGEVLLCLLTPVAESGNNASAEEKSELLPRAASQPDSPQVMTYVVRSPNAKVIV